MFLATYVSFVRPENTPMWCRSVKIIDNRVLKDYYKGLNKEKKTHIT